LELHRAVLTATVHVDKQWSKQSLPEMEAVAGFNDSLYGPMPASQKRAA
jgi:hypothetical protein